MILTSHNDPNMAFECPRPKLWHDVAGITIVHNKSIMVNVASRPSSCDTLVGLGSQHLTVQYTWLLTHFQSSSSHQ